MGKCPRWVGTTESSSTFIKRRIHIWMQSRIKTIYKIHTRERLRQSPTGVKIQGDNIRDDFISIGILLTFSKVSRSMVLVIFYKTFLLKFLNFLLKRE